VDAEDVILGGAAKAFAKRVGITEREVKEARAGEVSDLGGIEFRILLGTLSDGRTIRMLCRFDLPHYISSFRLVPS
jgi:hypothetical protein